jgi:hypothetical protein
MDPIMEGFGAAEVVHYPPYKPEYPPAPGPLVRANEWWGCFAWLIKGEPPTGEELHAINMPDIIDHALGRVDAAEEARLAPARWGAFNCTDQRAAGIPVGAAEQFAVDPVYIHYVEAAAQVEEWRWLTTEIVALSGEKVPGSGVILGLRDGGVVAVIAPIRWRPLP